MHGIWSLYQGKKKSYKRLLRQLGIYDCGQLLQLFYGIIFLDLIILWLCRMPLFLESVCWHIDEESLFLQSTFQMIKRCIQTERDKGMMEDINTWWL